MEGEKKETKEFLDLIKQTCSRNHLNGKFYYKEVASGIV